MFTPIFNKITASKMDNVIKLKTLCLTCWTARTGAIDAILKDYILLLEALEEIHSTTRDEYGLKANGLLHALEQFSTLFGLRLSHLLYSAAETVSLTLQRKDIAIKDALDAVESAKAYYVRLRSDVEFSTFYDDTVQMAKKCKIGEPQLPRLRRPPKRLDNGSDPHVFTSTKDYYRQIYFESCDLLIAVLDERFNKQHMSPVLMIERLLISAANAESFEDQMENLTLSCFKDDVNVMDLKMQLPLLPDVIRKGSPQVKKVTSIQTICEAMNTSDVYRSMLPAVHQMLRLYLTFPVTSSTSERTFSALRRVLTYMRASMTEQRLINCMLLHVHKDMTDSLDLVAVAKEFVIRSDDRKRYFGNY